MGAANSKHYKMIRAILCTIFFCAGFILYLYRRLAGICEQVVPEAQVSVATDTELEENGLFWKFLSFIASSWTDSKRGENLTWEEIRHSHLCSLSGSYLYKLNFIMQELLWEDVKTIPDMVSSVLSITEPAMPFVNNDSFIYNLAIGVFLTLVLLSSCYLFVYHKNKRKLLKNTNNQEDRGHSSNTFHHTDGYEVGIYNDSDVLNGQIKVSNRGCYRAKPPTSRSLIIWLMSWLIIIMMSAAIISIPWEFIRLYQIAVADRASKIIVGAPVECSPSTMSVYQSLKSMLTSHLSWTHGLDPCYEYHRALLVDPLWDVTPLMVLSSAITRCLLHPIELTSASLGRSLRHFFTEIPVQWQPLLMLMVIVTALVLMLMMFRYRLSIPMFLKIEPKSPECTRGISRDKTQSRRMLESDTRECGCSQGDFTTLRDVNSFSNCLSSPNLTSNLLKSAHNRKTLSEKDLWYLNDRSLKPTTAVSSRPLRILNYSQTSNRSANEKDRQFEHFTELEEPAVVGHSKGKKSQRSTFQKQTKLLTTGTRDQENVQKTSTNGQGRKRTKTSSRKKVDADLSWTPSSVEQ